MSTPARLSRVGLVSSCAAAAAWVAGALLSVTCAGTARAESVLPTSYTAAGTTAFYNGGNGWGQVSGNGGSQDLSTLVKDPTWAGVPDWTQPSGAVPTGTYKDYQDKGQRSPYVAFADINPDLTFRFGQVVDIHSISIIADNYTPAGVGVPFENDPAKYSVDLVVRDAAGNAVAGQESHLRDLNWFVVNPDGTRAATADQQQVNQWGSFSGDVTNAPHATALDGLDLHVAAGQSLEVVLHRSTYWTALSRVSFDGTVIPTAPLGSPAAAPLPAAAPAGLTLLAGLGLAHVRRSRKQAGGDVVTPNA